MRQLLLSTLLLMGAAAAAQAQVTVNIGNPVPTLAQAGSKQTLTVNFQLTLTAMQPSSGEEMTQAIMGANGALYQVVNKECETLTSTIAASCRLVGVNGNSNFNPRNGSNAIGVNASATYEIVLKPSPAPQ